MTTQIRWTKINNNTQTTEIKGRTFIAQKRVITTGKGNEPTVKWFIYRNDAQRPYADAYLWEPTLRIAKATFARLVEIQLAQEELAQLVKVYEEDYPMVDQPQPITYPHDIEVTAQERNWLVKQGLVMDMHMIASHTIRIFTAKEHAAMLASLEELANYQPVTPYKIGANNHIPANTSGKWQVWQFLFGWLPVSEHETEAEANTANDEIYNGKVVAPEPIVEEVQPAPRFGSAPSNYPHPDYTDWMQSFFPRGLYPEGDK